MERQFEGLLPLRCVEISVDDERLVDCHLHAIGVNVHLCNAGAGAGREYEVKADIISINDFFIAVERDTLNPKLFFFRDEPDPNLFQHLNFGHVSSPHRHISPCQYLVSTLYEHSAILYSNLVPVGGRFSGNPVA